MPSSDVKINGVRSSRHRQGDENVSQYSLSDLDEAANEREPRVHIQMAALRELRLTQDRLEAYVRTSFGLQARLSHCTKVLTWLSEAKSQPGKLESEDYWLRGADALERIDRLGALVRKRGLDETGWEGWGASFDDGLNASRTLVAGVRGADAERGREAAEELERTVVRMSSVAIDVFHHCEDQADEVIDAMKQNLEAIIVRIDAERTTLERLALGRAPLRSSEHDELGQLEKNKEQRQDRADQRDEQPDAAIPAGEYDEGAPTRESQTSKKPISGF